MKKCKYISPKIWNCQIKVLPLYHIKTLKKMAKLMKAVKSIMVVAKCSDNCNISFLDENQNEIGERDFNYVPDWMPEEHYGDYVEIEIEVATGKILNWKTPTQKQLKDSMD